MDQWFLVRDGREQGPVAEQQLKEMASKGQLQPTHKVRRGDMDKPVMAAKVRGLVFGNVAVKTTPTTTPRSAPQPPAPPQPSAPQGTGKETWTEKALVGLFALVIVGAVIGVQEFFKRGTAKQGQPTPATTDKAGTRRVFSTEDEFRRLVMGKSAAEVVAAVGRPDIVFSGGTFTNGVDYDESWGYKKTLIHAATGLPQDLKVFFDDDHVVETKTY
jgi:hypothetical protein